MRFESKKSLFALSILTLSILMFAIVPSAYAQTDCSEQCAGKVCVYEFYSPSCHACQSIEGFLKDFESKYNETVILHRFDVNEPRNFEIYSNFCSVQNLPMEQRGIPVMVTKDDFFMGTQDIRTKLEPSVIRLISENKTGCISNDICQVQENSTSDPTNTQRIITLPLVTLAALADSINPCAIGVLIFMVGFLMLSSGKNKARTLKIALLYIFTVYVAYFLAGIGILEVLTKISFLKWINPVFGAGVAILGIINIKDAIQDKPEGTLAIPTSAKPLIERWTYRASLPAAVILGVIVAAVELPCTGGMYLAILTLMANTVTRSTALWYLAFYNFIFVLPLILITLLFVFGFEGEKIQGYLDNHKRKSRGIMGVVLIGIGIFLMFL
jgi:cytochrome c biogenesis protein CcdA